MTGVRLGISCAWPKLVSITNTHITMFHVRTSFIPHYLRYLLNDVGGVFSPYINNSSKFQSSSSSRVPPFHSQSVQSITAINFSKRPGLTISLPSISSSSWIQGQGTSPTVKDVRIVGVSEGVARKKDRELYSVKYSKPISPSGKNLSLYPPSPLKFFSLSPLPFTPLHCLPAVC